MLASVRLLDIALALHIIGVVAGFGVLFAAPIAVPAARRAAGTASIAAGQLAVARTLVRGGLLLVLISGIYMASKLDVFSEWWVSVPFILIIVIGALNDGFLVPRYRAAAEGTATDVQLSQADTGERLLALTVLVAILVMVLGPML